MIPADRILCIRRVWERFCSVSVQATTAPAKLTPTLEINPHARINSGRVRAERTSAQMVLSPCQPRRDVLLKRRATQVSYEYDPRRSEFYPIIPPTLMPACLATVVGFLG